MPPERPGRPTRSPTPRSWPSRFRAAAGRWPPGARPWILVCAGEADAELAWQLADAVSAARDLPIAIVLPADDATRAAFPAAEIIATAPGTPVTLPQLGEEPVQLQRLTDEQYRQYLHALQVAEEPAEPAAGTWQLAEAHEQTAAAPRPEPHPLLRIRTSDGEAASDPGSPYPALLASVGAPRTTKADAPAPTDTPEDEAAPDETTPDPDEPAIDAGDEQPTAPEISVLGPLTVSGITPAWHTDRSAYAIRNDTQWTRSDNLPAYVIEKTGDLRVASGYRALDTWRCGSGAVHPCVNGGWGRCWKYHTTPRPLGILFDDLVRKTASGLIVPVEHKVGRTVHRFWVTDTDREQYYDILGGAPQIVSEDEKPSAHASRNAPTCRPQVTFGPVPTDRELERPEALGRSPAALPVLRYQHESARHATAPFVQGLPRGTPVCVRRPRPVGGRERKPDRPLPGRGKGRHSGQTRRRFHQSRNTAATTAARTGETRVTTSIARSVGAQTIVATRPSATTEPMMPRASVRRFRPAAYC
ncbi:hypothetical protein ACIA9I_38120 [Streptomyces anulatus]